MNLSTALPPTRSRRRHSALGAIGAGILAVSLMALASAAAPRGRGLRTNAPLNEMHPGRRRRAWTASRVAVASRDGARNCGRPEAEDRLLRGDPSCDSDPDLNSGLCTFRTQICINNTDPRLPTAFHRT